MDGRRPAAVRARGGHAEDAELLPATAARILYDREWQPPEPEWDYEPAWAPEREWAVG